MKMAKRWRKPRPEPPKYYWWDTDCCWPCKNRNGCSGCKHLKQYIAEGKQRNKKSVKDNIKQIIDFN